MSKTTTKTEVKCHYCGNDCIDTFILFEDKYLCSDICKNDLINSLSLHPDSETSCCSSSNNPANNKIKVTVDPERFNYLDDLDIQNKLTTQNGSYNGKNVTSVSLNIPGIHCTSCVGMLENIYKTNPGILSSKVEFLQKQIHIVYDSSVIKLKEIVKVLADAGYEARIDIHKDNEATGKSKSSQKNLYLKIGIAGFCLSNIMLLSFPEYLSLNNFIEGDIKTVLNYLNILLSLPVFFYCASDYFTSAWQGLKKEIH